VKTESRLEKVLSTGQFAVTAECGPPRGADVAALEKKGRYLLGYVDAVNVTDNQTAIVRMSSLAACSILKGLGHEPVVQMVTRDRNRIALQSDVFGAYALGIRNVLCLTGDHQSFGNQKEAAGAEIQVPPKMFIGAAENPFADPAEWRVVRLAKKVKAGADFIQTQCIFNINKFEQFMTRAQDMGLTESVSILAGITPLKSAGMARYMSTKVAGMDIPEEIIQRISALPKEEQPQEGIKIAVETIERVKEIKGVAGVHLMAIEWEERVPEILNAAGIAKRPKI
jgi:methylenetetrahydrofolate reductase (NADPH)